MVADVEIHRAGAERIDELEPLWSALQQYHVTVAPTLGGVRPRSSEDAWRRRRAKYAAWLDDPATFILLAERAARPVGYAFVTVGEGFQGWAADDRVADVQTLSVLPEDRGRSVGTRLMDAVEDEVLRLGVTQLRLLVISPNTEAIRFYEHRGLAAVSQVMFGPIRER